MARTYWLHLSTHETWREFQDHGNDVAGFRQGRWTIVKRMKPGDYLVCYLTRVSRWIGVLEIVGEPFFDEEPIWSSEVYPSRVRVRVVLALAPEHGVPVLDMRKELALFRGLSRPNHWSGPLRQSAKQLTTADGEAIVRALRAADAKELPGPMLPPSP